MKIRSKYKGKHLVRVLKILVISLLPYNLLNRKFLFYIKMHFSNEKYYYGLTKSGRSALSLLLINIKKDTDNSCNTILLPDYICNVVYEAAKYSGMEIVVYKTDCNFNPIIEDIALAIEGKIHCCVLLASIFGRRVKKEIIHMINEINPNCSIIYDESQNLICANKVTLDDKSHMIISFNNKMTPGLLGGVLITKNKEYISGILRPSIIRNIIYNIIMIATYVKQNIKILYDATTCNYRNRVVIEISKCKGKYSVEPYQISKISLCSAIMALKNIKWHQELLLENNNFIRSLEKGGYIEIIGTPDIDFPPYIPAKILIDIHGVIPLKGKYGMSDGTTINHAPDYSIIASNIFLYETIDKKAGNYEK